MKDYETVFNKKYNSEYYFEINGNRLTNSEKSLAEKDLKIISRLIDKTNFTDFSSIEKLYIYLQGGNIKFLSQIGKEFDDDIYDLYQEFKENNTQVNNSKEKTKKNNKSKNNKSKNNRNHAFDESQVDFYLKKELKKKENRRKWMILSFSLLGLACITYFAFYYYGADRTSRRLEELSNMVGSDALAGNLSNETNYEIHYTEDNYEIPPILQEYQSLYNSNKRLIGWLKIDDTIIDYPVLQCEDNVYYLSHNFDQEEDRCGSIFLDYRCDIIRGSDNFIIYGHHMSSGKMFASLEKYEQESYYIKHPLIQFDTIYEKQTFQIMYVFRSRVYNEEDVVFKYYDFINANSEKEFNSYMSEMEENSFYDTGITAKYGDQLLTLSTCDYNENNGRFVVVAKRVL